VDQLEQKLILDDNRVMSQALRAILDYLREKHVVINGYEIYLTEDGLADAIPVDPDGNRIDVAAVLLRDDTDGLDG
jgi:hypothetical protein